jgi:hypothetical protein
MSFDQLGFVPPVQQVTVPLVAPVEVDHIGCVKANA